MRKSRRYFAVSVQIYAEYESVKFVGATLCGRPCVYTDTKGVDKMAERKKRRRIRRKTSSAPSSLRLGVLITVLVLIVVAAGVLMAPVFKITQVYCEGNSHIKTEDITVAAQIENGEHILLANIGKAKKQIENIPLVKEASVRRVFPDKICITVNERTPAAYVMRGAECIALDTEGVVLEIINDGRAEAISKEYTPEPEKEAETGEDTDKKKSTDKKSSESEDESGTEENSKPENSENTEITADKPFMVPLVAGMEVSEAEDGRVVEVKDKDKLEKVIAIFDALSKAQLLERATYIDVNNLSDIRIIVEKRLDIYIGGTDNIEYRTKFLAEVINTKISSYENVVMDYRGDDIYVRPPEDGKDRIIKKEKDKDDNSDKSEEDDSEDSDEASESDEADDEDDADNTKKAESDNSKEDEEEGAEEKAQSSMSLEE